MSTYTITREQYNATLDKVNETNARAARKGLTGQITFTGKEVTVTKTDEITGIERTYEAIEAELGGTAPKYDGWTFVATLDWDPNAGLVVRTAPGIETVDRAALTARQCDHCKVDRYRKETYLLRHEDGREVQVGSSCIKDFLGTEVNISWLDSQSFADELEGFSFGFGRSRGIDHGTEYVLALAWALIKLDGWRPASSSYGTTKGDVLAILYPPFPATEEYREWASRVRVLSAEAMERATEVRKFILSDEFSGDSEYVRNLKAIAEADLVSDRNIGYLVSAPQAWARHLEKTLVREAQVSQKPSEWVGKVGDKITITATIRNIRFIETSFGPTTLYVLKGTDGNIFKWFSTREALGDQVDVEVTIKGTIKSHDEYQGVKETILTRCKEV